MQKSLVAFPHHGCDYHPQSAVAEWFGMMATDDGLGGDFSAIRAHAHLELHEKQCVEWRAEIRAALAAIHERLNSQDRKMWTAAASAIAFLVVATASLLVMIINMITHISR